MDEIFRTTVQTKVLSAESVQKKKNPDARKEKGTDYILATETL